jgi:hypothetical protein
MKTWRVAFGSMVEANSREEAWAQAKRMIREMDPKGIYLDSGPMAVSENMQWPW